jgi:hypothetical protein
VVGTAGAVTQAFKFVPYYFPILEEQFNQSRTFDAHLLDAAIYSPLKIIRHNVIKMNA